MTQFIAELKQSAVHCEFGPSLDDALRDRFVSGIRGEACQRRLLSENNLTFARAVEIAVSMETADKDTQQLRRTDESATSVHKVQENSSPRNKCYRCTGKSHNANECHLL